jgi:hypothetical protein
MQDDSMQVDEGEGINTLNDSMIKQNSVSSSHQHPQQQDDL